MVIYIEKYKMAIIWVHMNLQRVLQITCVFLVITQREVIFNSEHNLKREDQWRSRRRPEKNLPRFEVALCDYQHFQI